MPKQKTHSGAKKRFKVTAAGKILRNRRHRTTPPGKLVKSQAKRKRSRRNGLAAPSDLKSLKKLLGKGGR